MTQTITNISLWIIPVLISLILIYAVWKRVPVFETFVDGAKDGFHTAIKILPHLVGMMVAITIFRDSGALSVLTNILSPIFDLLHFPEEVFPLAMLRPITGTGALAIMTDLIAEHGPDSFIGRLASTMQGSTDTTLYVFTVYFGAVGIKKAGYALKVGLLADLIAIIASVIIVSAYFG